MTQMRSHNWLITSCIINEFEKNESKTLEGKSPLYIFGKSRFLDLANGRAEGTFLNDSNFASRLFGLELRRIREH